ncbi:MAG: 50S ribosomal protein L32 [Cellulomonas sp.]|jgi:large subunit ribosomal protein L32|nr:50S ribosomal protein L32 [Cellulomonas sp.]
MAVPKRRMSRANTRSRRSQWKAAPVSLSTCPSCGAARRPHVACPACGVYGERTLAQAVRSEHETY